MVAVRLEGRLGNQLFQYGFIFATAKKLDTSFYLDKSIDNFLLPQYFEVEEDFLQTMDKKVFSIKGYKNIFKVYLKRAVYGGLKLFVFGNRTVTIRNETAVADALKQIKNNVLYIGYFQAQDYFENYQSEIRKLFSIKKEYVDAFGKIRAGLRKNARKAVIHIRRGDYVGLNISLPMSYYRNAIASISGEDIQYIFISDDPDFIRNEFADLPDKYISTHNEIIDLQLLANADFCILSNSSFSWWGAWLNTNPEKKVFAPENWLGFNEKKEFPAGIGSNLDFNWIPV